MTTLNSKNELKEVLNQPEFVERILINNRDDYLDKPGAFQNAAGEYFANPWDEEGSGMSLFSTPKKGGNYGGGQWGTWLKVSKLYGDNELPFRVTAVDYAPHGTEMDQDEHIADFKTLGEAMDQAFWMHEHGSINLHVLLEDEDAGRYVNGQNEVVVPAMRHGHLSPDALEVNDLLGIRVAEEMRRQQAKDEERRARLGFTEKAWATPISIEAVRPITASIREKLATLTKDESRTNVMHIAATAMNTRLFAGTGKLLSCECPELLSLPIFPNNVGSVFVAVEREPGAFSYISADGGVFDDAQSAKDSVSKALKEFYAKEFIEENLLWIDGELWEVDLNKVEFEIVEPVEIPEVSDFNCYERIENLVDDVVVAAAKDQRRALVEQMVKDTQRAKQQHEREPEISLGR